MLIYLKKIIARCLFPVPLVLETALLGALLLRWKRTRRAGKGLLILSMLLLYTASLPVTGRLLLGSLESRYAACNPAEIIRMTAADPITIGVAGSGLDRQGRFSDDFLVRLQEAGRIAGFLAETGCSFQLVISEANRSMNREEKRSALVKYFKPFGVAEDRIVLISEALNSRQEVEAFCAYPGTLVLVSQAFHMPRLMALVEAVETVEGVKTQRSCSLKVEGARSALECGDSVTALKSCDDRVREIIPAPAGRKGLENPLTILDFIPSAGGLRNTETVIYEWLGMMAVPDSWSFGVQWRPIENNERSE